MTFGLIGLGHQGTPMAERMIGAGLRPWLWARRQTYLIATREPTPSSPALRPSWGLTAISSGSVSTTLKRRTASSLVLKGSWRRSAPGPCSRCTAPWGRPTCRTWRPGSRAPGLLRGRTGQRGRAAAVGKLLVMTGGGEELCVVCAPMFATYADRVVRTGPLGSAQAAKLINNSLVTAITGLVFDAFDMGAALEVDRERLGEVLANGSAANPSVGIYTAIGADEFSSGAWPALHKDVALAQLLAVDTKLLLDTAEATIADMGRRRKVAPATGE